MYDLIHRAVLGLPPAMQRALRPGYASRLRRVQSPGAWCVDGFSLDRHGSLSATGWALSDGTRSPVQFSVCGERVEAVEYAIRRPDVGRAFWFMPDAAYSGFRFAVPLPSGDSDLVSFERSFPGTGTASLLAAYQAYYLHLGRLDHVPLPPASLRTRVHGSSARAAFILEGYSTYHKLDLYIRNAAGVPISGVGRVLDWGCGCGRVSRYFPPSVSLSGVDVDLAAVDWCRSHLPAMHSYNVIDALPPTSFPPQAFDVVLGISILTHLTEEAQEVWLRELHRIVAPAGLILLSIHGYQSACRMGLGPGSLSRLMSEQAVDRGPNRHAQATGDERRRYRDTFQTGAHVSRLTQGLFTTESVLPGIIGLHQDLIVLRKQ